jgi:hypothetical protein
MNRFILVASIAEFIALPSAAQETQAPAAAATTCTAPGAPPPYLPAALPESVAAPRCLDLEKGTSTCSDRVLRDYNAKVTARNAAKQTRVSEMNAYGRELQKYQHAATSYAQCEQERVSKLLPD